MCNISSCASCCWLLSSSLRLCFVSRLFFRRFNHRLESHYQACEHMHAHVYMRKHTIPTCCRCRFSFFTSFAKYFSSSLMSSSSCFTSWLRSNWLNSRRCIRHHTCEHSNLNFEHHILCQCMSAYPHTASLMQTARIVT